MTSVKSLVAYPRMRFLLGCLEQACSGIYAWYGCGETNVTSLKRNDECGVLTHQHHSADRDAAVEIGDVLVGHAEAAGGYGVTDRFGFVRAVNAIERRTQIHGACTQRIFDAAG